MLLLYKLRELSRPQVRVDPRQRRTPVGEVLSVLDWREEKVHHVALLPVGRHHGLTDLVLDAARLVDDEYVRGAHSHGLDRGHSQC